MMCPRQSITTSFSNISAKTMSTKPNWKQEERGPSALPNQQNANLTLTLDASHTIFLPLEAMVSGEMFSVNPIRIALISKERAFRTTLCVCSGGLIIKLPHKTGIARQEVECLEKTGKRKNGHND